MGGLATHCDPGNNPADYLTNSIIETSTSSTSSVMCTVIYQQFSLPAAVGTAIGTDDYVAFALGNKHTGSNAGNIRSNSVLMYRIWSSAGL